MEKARTSLLAMVGGRPAIGWADNGPAAGCLPPAGRVEQVMRFTRSGRLALTVVLAIYGFRILLHPEAGWFMDSVDLPIHETGHLVFSPFGEFMQFAGGSLFQVILPAVFVGYFFRRKDRHGASICLWWVAQSLWNVSVYVKDARAQELPLVGGGEHDWAYLLGELNVLPRDQVIGHAVWLAGVVAYLIAISIGVNASLSATDEVAEPAGALESV